MAPTWEDRSVSRRAWKASPSGSAILRSPNQLISSTVASNPASCSAVARPAAVPLACTTKSASRAAPPGCVNATPSAFAAAAFSGSVLHQLHRAAGQARRQPRAQTTQRPRSHHRDPVADARCRIPQPVHHRFEVRGQYGSARGHLAGQRVDGVRGHDVARLVGIQTEHRLSEQRPRPALHDADADVSVFDGRREIARLKRCPHALVLAGRHPPGEDQALRTAADGAVQRTYQHLSVGGLRQGFGADLAASRPP